MFCVLARYDLLNRFKDKCLNLVNSERILSAGVLPHIKIKHRQQDLLSQYAKAILPIKNLAGYDHKFLDERKRDPETRDPRDIM